jgi:hypothetical protein
VRVREREGGRLGKRRDVRAAATAGEASRASSPQPAGSWLPFRLRARHRRVGGGRWAHARAVSG